MTICSVCGKDKLCSLMVKKGKIKTYVCDECAYPKQIPFEVWSKNLSW